VPDEANSEKREQILSLYRSHPHTTGRVTKADRKLAEQLLRKQVALADIEAAMILVAARRSRAPQTQNNNIQSLNYFLNTIREVQMNPLDNHYLDYLRHIKHHRRPNHQTT